MPRGAATFGRAQTNSSPTACVLRVPGVVRWPGGKTCVMAVAGFAVQGVRDRGREAWTAWRPSVVLAAGALLVTRVVVWAAGMVAAGLFGLSWRAIDFDP